MSNKEDRKEASILITILSKVMDLPDCSDKDYNRIFLVFNQFAKTGKQVRNQQINEIIQSLSNKDSFRINDWIEEEFTAAHLAAKAGNIQLTELIISQPRFDPNTVDGLGNTVLFYICEHFPPNMAKGHITSGDIAWNFNTKNDMGQTVYDYYEKTTGRDPFIYELLRKKCGIQHASLARMYL